MNQAVNRFNSALKSGFLTWESMGIDFFLESASSGHPVNCSLLHFRIGLIAQPGVLPLDGPTQYEVDLMKAQGQVRQSKNVENVENVENGH